METKKAIKIDTIKHTFCLAHARIFHVLVLGNKRISVKTTQNSRFHKKLFRHVQNKTDGQVLDRTVNTQTIKRALLRL
jgi:hypothetical protein